MLGERESAKLVSGRRIDNDAPIACRHQIRPRQWRRIPHPPKAKGRTRALQAYLGHKNIQHTVRYTELPP
jgi:site-specific recombinase XerC